MNRQPSGRESDGGSHFEMVMCLDCGEFVTTVRTEGRYEPVPTNCPDCDGTSFKHNGSGQVIETD